MSVPRHNGKVKKGENKYLAPNTSYQSAMLPIYICEDNSTHRKYIETIVKDYIAKSNRLMEIVLSTDSPTELLDYLSMYPSKKGVYFLDVNLQHDLSGIELASEIRKFDYFSKIVFITSHSNLSHLVFSYHIEPLDYIVKRKENIKERINECLDIAHNHFQQTVSETEFYEIQSVEGIRKIPVDEIIFFETHLKSHRLTLHLEYSRVNFYSSLNKIEKEIRSGFFRSHKSYLVNIKNIRRVNKLERVIEMSNGETALVSRNKVNQLLELISAH